MAITYDTGIGQYLLYGTASANTYAGRVTGGELRSSAEHVWRPSVGAKHALGRGIWNGGGSATIEIANATLIGYALRSGMTSPALTALYFEGGLRDALGNNHGWSQSGCAISELELNLAVDDPLTAAITWLASDQADAVPGGTYTPTSTHFEWYEGQCTFQGGTYDMKSMNVRVNNNIVPISTIESKSAGTLTLPEDFKIGKETVNVTIDMYAYPGTTAWDLEADAGITGLVASMIAVSGGNTFTAAIANIAGSMVRMPFEGDDGEVLLHFEGESEPNNASSIAVSYA